MGSPMPLNEMSRLRVHDGAFTVAVPDLNREVGVKTAARRG